MINHAMFQRNGKAGYVLKPAGLRSADRALLLKTRKYQLRLMVSFKSDRPVNSDMICRSSPDSSFPRTISLQEIKKVR